MINQFKKLFIHPETKAIEAMKIIDAGSAQIALVVDEKECLLGTLTDGDIRRGLLDGESLNSPVSRMMNKDFFYVSKKQETSNTLNIMRLKSLRQVPVLDNEKKIIKLLLLKDLLEPQKINNAVVIMAGGKGTRLLPHTEKCPKPMLPIGGRPILEILLEQYIANGFHNFYFSVNYLKDQIISHFKDGSDWGVKINYLIEDTPLGTAGSLQLLPKGTANPFIVINGDVLTRLDSRQLLEFHLENNSKATICVREYETTLPFGVIKTKGVELESIQEKPTYKHQVNAGIYVIDPSILQFLPTSEFIDMPTFINEAQRGGNKITVFPVHEYWIDVGRPDTLKAANRTWDA